jgi:energy-coupling factor transporter ATP-binding protein EcfA2
MRIVREKRNLVLEGVTVVRADEEGRPVGLLRDVHLRLAPGEWVYLVGVNGSGKSTLVRLLAGLYGEGTTGRIDRGFAGEAPAPIVMQRPESQLFGDTPREETLFALEWRPHPALEPGEAAQEALEATGLTALADAAWTRLSGGERQLAAIAAATAGAAPLVVFDEATSMLDERNRRRVLDIARRCHASGAAVVWVTQRLDELEPDRRVIALFNGRIGFDGSVREFFYGDGGGGESREKENMHDLSPCERCGLSLPFLAVLARQWRRAGRLADPLPVTREEWAVIWRRLEHG